MYIMPVLQPTANIQRHHHVASQMDALKLGELESDKLLTAVKEELDEFQTLTHNPKKDPQSLLKYQLEDEYGDALYSLLNVARFFKIDTLKALHRTLDKIELRLQVLKELSASPPEGNTKDVNKALWQQAKNLIRSRYPRPNGIQVTPS
jgi:tetrapyrrole methylase family protein / MazG family protein